MNLNHFSCEEADTYIRCKRKEKGLSYESKIQNHFHKLEIPFSIDMNIFLEFRTWF